jgi:hypothetical protein
LIFVQKMMASLKLNEIKEHYRVILLSEEVF